MLSMNQQNHRQNSLKEAWLILVLSIPAPNNSGEVFFFFLTKNHWKNILENLALLIKHACLTLFPPAFSSKSSRSSFSERLSDIVCLKMLLFCLFFLLFCFFKKRQFCWVTIWGWWLFSCNILKIFFLQSYQFCSCKEVIS